MQPLSFLFLGFLFFLPAISLAKELPKIAVWDLTSGDMKEAYAQDLTLILASEVSKLGKYEVYSQENVRTLAGWTAERMTLGCTDTKCLTALGQMDISKLISGRVGKIGDRFSVSLSLFDTQNAKAERMVSEFCRSENELIELVQMAVRKLLRETQTAIAFAPQMEQEKEKKGIEGENRKSEEERPTLSGTYVGCYRDDQEKWGIFGVSLPGRDLNGLIIESNYLTTDLCISICKEKGFMYAGTQYSKHCFCGNVYGKYGKAENCNMPCSGNPLQICGGKWANSVYQVK